MIPGTTRDNTFENIFFRQVLCQILKNYFSLANLICAVQKRSQLRNLSDGASEPVQGLRGVATVDRCCSIVRLLSGLGPVVCSI